MIFPNLPTDNLYKFCALTGIVIIILSVFFVEKKVNLVTDEIVDASAQADILQVQFDLILKRDERIQAETERKYGLVEGNKGSREPEKSNDNLHKELNQQLNQFEETMIEKQIEIIKQRANIKRLENLHNRSVKIVIWSVVFISIGYVMAHLGFWKWYVKVQKPQDLILQAQLEEHVKPRTQESGL